MDQSSAGGGDINVSNNVTLLNVNFSNSDISGSKNNTIDNTESNQSVTNKCKLIIRINNIMQKILITLH